MNSWYLKKRSFIKGSFIFFAIITAPLIAKEVQKMNLRKRLNNKLTEKKQYIYVLRNEVIFNIGIMTAIGILGEENREVLRAGDTYITMKLTMDIEQKTGIDLAVRDYLRKVIEYEKYEELEKRHTKTMVWK